MSTIIILDQINNIYYVDAEGKRIVNGITPDGKKVDKYGRVIE